MFFAFSSCSDSMDFPDLYENITIIYWMGDNGLSSTAEKDIEELVVRLMKQNYERQCRMRDDCER